jgi:hypothetical protein
MTPRTFQTKYCTAVQRRQHLHQSYIIIVKTITNNQTNNNNNNNNRQTVKVSQLSQLNTGLDEFGNDQRTLLSRLALHNQRSVTVAQSTPASGSDR